MKAELGTREVERGVTNEQWDLRERTKRFALEVIRLVESLPPGRTSDVLGKQLLRSATSVGANYREARKARSAADFVSKISIAEAEAEESLYWLELLRESRIAHEDLIVSLVKEADELTAILTASGKTAKQNIKKRR